MEQSIPVSEKVEFFSSLHRYLRNQKEWKINPKKFADFFTHVTVSAMWERVRFVRTIDYCPFAVVISLKGKEDILFESFKNGAFFSNAPNDTAEFLRENPNESIYIQLKFPAINNLRAYRRVLEENPYLSNDEVVVEAVLDNSILQLKERRLLEEIDVALLNNDKVAFIRLTTRLNELRKNNENKDMIS